MHRAGSWAGQEAQSSGEVPSVASGELSWNPLSLQVLLQQLADVQQTACSFCHVALYPSAMLSREKGPPLIVPLSKLAAVYGRMQLLPTVHQHTCPAYC